jgi:predicted  nucleic acid-binding Zn-ribbon protein
MTDPGRKNLRLTEDVCERIEDVAEQRGLAQNELVIEIIEKTLGVDEDSEAYLRRRSETLADRESQLRDEIQTLVGELQNIRQQHRDVTERLQRIEEERRELTEIFDVILTDMDENPNKTIEAYKSHIEDAIRVKHDTGPSETKRDDIVADIRARASAHDDISVAPERLRRGVGGAQQSADGESDSQGLQLKTAAKRNGGETDG